MRLKQEDQTENQGQACHGSGSESARSIASRMKR